MLRQDILVTWTKMVTGQVIGSEIHSLIKSPKAIRANFGIQIPGFISVI